MLFSYNIMKLSERSLRLRQSVLKYHALFAKNLRSIFNSELAKCEHFCDNAYKHLRTSKNELNGKCHTSYLYHVRIELILLNCKFSLINVFCRADTPLCIITNTYTSNLPSYALIVIIHRIKYSLKLTICCI